MGEVYVASSMYVANMEEEPTSRQRREVAVGEGRRRC